MNIDSQPLQKHEIEKIKSDPKCLERFVASYEMMLHFYGCTLEIETGKVSRGSNFYSQYRNLVTHSHNFLRITRILKSLGELGFEHYKKPFLLHFIEEIWTGDRLLAACSDSCTMYWVGTLRDDNHRREIQNLIRSYSPWAFPASDDSDVGRHGVGRMENITVS
eukprot:TRINITY_DN16055_c0_g1_i1.p1 TRINITY_DN16055_c0_g1~~TRINITY_DN16055_c0_g1_i1.p1  ORF type:complete len:164 (+),score=18.23 TRINITY_DN16055_c0_g1_i1:330-821(+)